MHKKMHPALVAEEFRRVCRYSTLRRYTDIEIDRNLHVPSGHLEEYCGVEKSQSPISLKRTFRKNVATERKKWRGKRKATANSERQDKSVRQNREDSLSE